MKTIAVQLLCLFLGTCLSAQDIFLFQDKSCLDRYQYRFIEKNIDLDYIAYVIHQADGQITHLEIGVENDRPTTYLPGRLTSCTSIKWNQQFVEDVNSGRTKLSIVRKEDKQYYTSPVSLITVMSNVNGQWNMYGSGYDFTSSLNEPVGQVNLGKEGTASDVYYKGDLIFYNCPVYQFMRMPRVTCKAFTECTIMPGIGIIEERTGEDAAEADENVLRLTGINNISIEEYIKTHGCSTEVAAPKDVPVSYSQPVFRETKTSSNPREWTDNQDINSQQPATEIKGAAPVAAVNPCTEQPAAGSHIVQSGENLYSIARKYGLTVGQLREWNHISKDVIRPCQRLTLVAPVVIAPLVVESKPVTAVTPPKPKTTAKPATKKSVPAATVAVAKNTTAVRKVAVNKNVAKTATTTKPAQAVPQLWKTNKGFHTVQSGETISLLARMYGFSQERLMEMNDLKTTELKVGQILKINDCVCDADKMKATTTSSTKTTATAPSPDTTPAAYSNIAPGSRLKKTVTPSDVPAQAPDTEIVSSGSTTTVYRSDVLTEKGTVLHYHTVSEGETLYTIARLYNTTVDELRTRNELDPYEVLIIGQRLVVK